MTSQNIFLHSKTKSIFIFTDDIYNHYHFSNRNEFKSSLGLGRVIQNSKRKNAII